MKSPGHDKSRQFSSCSFTLRLSAPLDVSPQVTTCNSKALRNRPLDHVDFTWGFTPSLGWWFFFDPISVSSPGFAICKHKRIHIICTIPTAQWKKNLQMFHSQRNHPPSFIPALPLPNSAAKAPLLGRIFWTSRNSSQLTSLYLKWPIGKYGLPREWNFLVIGVGAVLCLTSSFLWRGFMGDRDFSNERTSALKCGQKSSQWVASVKCSSSFRCKTPQKNYVELKEKPS